jgi:hypothetical protein
VLMTALTAPWRWCPCCWPPRRRARRSCTRWRW